MADETFRPRRLEESPGLEIKGNPPPEFQKIIEQQALQQMSENGAMPPMQAQMPVTMPMQAQMPVTMPMPMQPQTPVFMQNTEYSNPNLKEVLDAIKRTTEVYEKITLPSKGKFYDGINGPKDGVLHIRPMKGSEEQILAQPRFTKKGIALNMIFQQCIKETFKVEKLLTVDRTFILLYLRGISYSSGLDVETSCPACDQKFSQTIDLSTLEVETCEDNFNGDLRDVLPTTKIPFSYRFSTGEDDQNVSEHRERRAKAFGDQALDDTIHYKIAMLTNDIAGVTNKNEIQIILKDLPMGDINYLRNCINEPPFGVQTEVEMSCPNCLNNFQMELPNDQNFFFPKKKKQDNQA